MYGNSTEFSGNMGKAATAPDNHLAPTDAQCVQSLSKGARALRQAQGTCPQSGHISSIKQLTDHAIREQLSIAGQDQHVVFDHYQAPRYKINKATLLSAGE